MTEFSRRQLWSALPALGLASDVAAKPRQRLSQSDLEGVATRRHAAWLKGESSGAFAVLKDRDLSGLCFDGLDLRYADLSASDLTGIKAEGLQADRAMFTGASLMGARFVGASLDGAVFDRADLREAQILDLPGPLSPRLANQPQTASLLGARFVAADLSYARIQAYIAGALFFSTKLVGTDFSYSLGQPIFRQTDLHNAHFHHCDFNLGDCA